MNTALQILFGLILVILVNYLGRWSIHLGYIRLMDLFNKGDFKYNFVLRVLSPAVFVVFLSIVLYKFNYPNLVVDIWKVSIWYSVVTTLILIVMNRLTLVNIKILLLIHVLSIYITFFIYTGAIIKGPEFLLPDEVNLRTEIWILIAVYLYSLLGRYEGVHSNSLVHTRRVIRERLQEIKKKYVKLIPSRIISNPFLRDTVLSIMIYEDINRPAFARSLERLFWRPLKVKTFGVMQFSSPTPISDKRSIT